MLTIKIKLTNTCPEINDYHYLQISPLEQSDIQKQKR